MNNEQLQDWLSEVNTLCSRIMAEQQSPKLEERVAMQGGGRAAMRQVSVFDAWRKLLTAQQEKTQLLMNYLVTNYSEANLSQPLLAELLALYYKLGPGRLFALQLLPTLITCYLLAVSKRQMAVAAVLEHYLLAVYNEEILAGGPAAESLDKRVDEVRVPSVRQCPSVYHDPAKLISLPPGESAASLPAVPTSTPSIPAAGGAAASAQRRRSGIGGDGGVQCVVRIGPYPAVERINAENRFLVLTRLLNSLNALLGQLPTAVVCRSTCLSLLKLCRSGFTFPESDFRQRVLKERASDEVVGSRDYSKKRRVPLAPHFLVECLNTVNFALFNGFPDLALRALDAVHHRAQYEMYPDVLLQTNALRNSLLDQQTVRMMLDSWADAEVLEA